LIERELAAGVGDDVEGDYVGFLQAGQPAKGSFRCSDCGYGIVVTAGLPICPMCAGTAWEQSEWSPFGRSTPL
jgi:rubrerythrin